MQKIEGPSYLANKETHNAYLLKHPYAAKKRFINLSTTKVIVMILSAISYRAAFNFFHHFHVSIAVIEFQSRPPTIPTVRTTWYQSAVHQRRHFDLPSK